MYVENEATDQASKCIDIHGKNNLSHLYFNNNFPNNLRDNLPRIYSQKHSSLSQSVP